MRWTTQQYREWISKHPAPAVGAVGRCVGKPSAVPALVKDAPTKPRRKGSLAYRVSIISCRVRLLDSDNNGSGGNKALRDEIAAWLGIDDGSERIQFEYAQLHTSGEEGTIVKIEKARRSPKRNSPLPSLSPSVPPSL